MIIILEASDFTGLEFQMRRLRDLRDGKPVKVHRVQCSFVMAPHIYMSEKYQELSSSVVFFGSVCHVPMLSDRILSTLLQSEASSMRRIGDGW